MAHLNRGAKYLKLAGLCLWLSGSLLSAAFANDDGYRVFTSSDGREITAKVEAYNPETREVEIRKDNNVVYGLQLDRFSDADQAFILEWRDVFERSYIRTDFISLTIPETRFLIIMEASSSLGDEQWKRLVRRSTESFERFDPKVEFDLLLFSSALRPFNGSLVQANGENRERVSEWLGAHRISRSGDLLRAIKYSVRYTDVEAIVVVAETTPREGGEELMAVLRAAQAKRATPFVVHTIAVGDAPGRDVLSEMAEEFGGTFTRY